MGFRYVLFENKYKMKCIHSQACIIFKGSYLLYFSFRLFTLSLFIASFSYLIIVLFILFYAVIQEIPNLTLSCERLLLLRSAPTVDLKFNLDELFYFATPRIIPENSDVTSGFVMSPYTTPWSIHNCGRNMGTLQHSREKGTVKTVERGGHRPKKKRIGSILLGFNFFLKLSTE